MQEYTNKNGVRFFIETAPAPVPKNADYYGFFFYVIAGEKDNLPAKTYKAMIEKRICQSENQASIWLNTTALDFLKGVLETYENGQTLLLLPASDGWWVI
ncbi:hypothetical protein J7J47_06950 [Halomonas sp. ISL-60]|uniref:hypothetical protein n=1 Tax=Halomonas sp. ISL-56 TaxID=2819149 RepID=UPI001BEC5995|nr:hypothetical protein [Halomonas sp. ISL-56]MBT2771974.1 hypothetical protein [Halomonas sp. ISL-60]MBT2802942.1 hypothetical protein [Halomonas sp. ISL-56]